MQHFISQRWTKLLPILMLLSVSLACVSLTGGDPAGTQVPQAAVSDEVNVEFGPGPFDFPDTREGLADLASYKATLTLSFDGTRDGLAEQWSKTYVMLTTKEPAARQLTLEKAGDLADLDPVFMAEADGAGYERRGMNDCTADVIEAGDSLGQRLEPAGFLTFVIGAEEAGSESVNGIAAKHYTFDERAFGQPGLAKSTGELWVASEGGQIVKYILTTKGNADYFGEGIQGTLTLDYKLSDLNQPVTFNLPADCPAGLVDAPLLPDASNVLSLPSLLTYDTASSLADAAAFYQAQIPDLGWTPAGEPTLADNMALLIFSQGDQELTVVIGAAEGVTNVQILLARAQR